jgi:peptide deformylase
MEEIKTNEVEANIAMTPEEKIKDAEVTEIVEGIVDQEIKKLKTTYPILEKIVEPHNKKSRLATEDDVENIVKLSQTLYEICTVGAYAMHHSQIESEDPISFFVTKERKIIINPKIIRHSNYFADSNEGCMSFLLKDRVTVPRWQKLEVEYQTIMVDPENKDKFKLSSVISEDLSGKDAHVFQHELDHGNAVLIYPIIK